MTRDYKNSRRKKPQPVPGGVWFLAGLITGAALSLLVYFQVRPGVIEQPIAAVTSPPEPESGQPEPERSFDFYTLLPELEVVVPDSPEPAPVQQHIETIAPAPQPTAAAALTRYILQAGSFQKEKDADGLKANLALLGVEASIQTVKIDDNIWHRVRVGPYTDLGSVKQVRKQLKRNAIDTLLVKEKK
ncbi:MAG: SPOR domain-containing protein [Gammaproteobacteria bacterium]